MSKKESNKQVQTKIKKYVENILYTKRNNDWKGEEKACQKFYDYCNEKDLDIKMTYEWAVRQLQSSVAAIMNGIV